MNKMIQREKIEGFERAFESLHLRAVELLDAFPEGRLFVRTQLNGEPFDSSSFGFELLRSAAEVEKTFGGITTRLWDDPFEWTLPEELSSRSRIADYIDEVKSTRVNGLRFLQDDDDLLKIVPAPIDLRPIAEILLHTIERSERHLGRASLLSSQTDNLSVLIS